MTRALLVAALLLVVLLAGCTEGPVVAAREQLVHVDTVAVQLEHNQRTWRVLDEQAELVAIEGLLALEATDAVERLAAFPVDHGDPELEGDGWVRLTFEQGHDVRVRAGNGTSTFETAYFPFNATSEESQRERVLLCQEEMCSAFGTLYPYDGLRKRSLEAIGEREAPADPSGGAHG